MLSVITPCNHLRYIKSAYNSLLAQTYPDWRWIVLPNGGVTREDLSFLSDPRVIVLDPGEALIDADQWQNVGALKAECARLAPDSSLALVELDHDDLLTPDALSLIHQVFEQNPDIGMVYSNCAYLDGEVSAALFDPAHGWEYRDREVMGYRLREIISPEPWPQNLSRIWYAPDHVRAWRTSVYREMGGHLPNLPTCDDHDLTCCFYAHSKIAHIDQLLYLYRVHGSNTWLARNQDIQTRQWSVYEKWVWKLIERWCADNNLARIDLGAGHDKPDGFIGFDQNHGPGVDYLCDLNGPWPLEENSVGCIRAHDLIEHLRSPVHTMNEAYRALRHGGFFMIEVPSTDGRGAFQDPTHISWWNENSFWYYSNSRLQRYISHTGITARFQVMRLRTYYPTAWHQANRIPYVQAHLLAVKDGLRFHGLLEI